MKKIYLVLCIFCYATTFAQNPLIIKTVNFTPAEPVNSTYAYGTNTKWNGKVFYQAKGDAPLINLAVTDGTDAGTFFIKNIGLTVSAASSGISQMVAAQNFIYISTLSYISSFSTAKYELWRSDGTAAGTILLKSFDVTSSKILQIANSTGSTSQPVINVIGDVIYFTGYDAVNGNELWKSDGTAAGTSLIKDINSGSGNSLPQGFCRVGSKILFTASATGGFSDLWQTDGTEAGTTLLKDISPGDNTFGASGQFGSALYKGKMYFYASESATGNELWSSDGTEAGTNILLDINPGPASSLPSLKQDLTLMQDSNYLYFVTRANTTAPYHVWRTDGTVGGTIQLTTAANAIYNSNGIAGSLNAYRAANGVYFASFADSLYVSNGTVAGTKKIEKRINAPRAFFTYKNALWFTGRNPSLSDAEPWRSDGLPGNTNRALNIYPGVVSGIAYSSSPFGFFELNNYLYFFAVNASGKHLFRYDGDMTFNGSVAGLNWRDSANWNSMIPPGITDTAYINTGLTANITINKAYAGTLYMLNGSIINFPATTDSLFINNSLEGTAATGNGALVLKNFNGDTARLNTAFTASNLNVAGFAAINGNLTINNNLTLTGNARLIANNSNIILTGSTTTIDNAVNNYIVTNGTGKLQIENIGAGGRTANVVFPIGSSVNYNPVTLNNTGAMDIFGARTEPGIKNNYSGETPTGSSYSTGALNNTWFITEATPGGSIAGITLQWNASQELTMFNRALSQFGHYTGGAWQLGSLGAASGIDPFTFTGTGITSFSPFSIFNSGAVLPINSAVLLVTKTNNGNILKWNINSINDELIFIERSFNGAQFTTLKSQNFIANGNYTDLENTVINKVYYRLKITNRNGRISYSNIVFIIDNNQIKVSVYPTIFTDHFIVQNNTVNKQTLQLYQADGKLLISRLINAGTNVVSLPQLTSGIYLYKIFDGTNVIQGRLMK